MWNAVFRFLSVIGLLALAAAGADRAPLEVELESGKPFSIGFLTYIDHYPDDGAGRWDRESPMTVWKLEGAPGGMELFLRLNKKRPILTFFGKKSGVNRTFDALSELPPGAYLAGEIVGMGNVCGHTTIGGIGHGNCATWGMIAAENAVANAGK